MRINPDDLVLEIGSGDRPNPRSDVLCDRYIDDNTERGGNLQIDRPLICGDGHYLPFKDKAFDYVIASHIIEHMDDPVKFCQELMRVSRRGYIESPTEIAEKLFFWSFHKWYVNHIGDSIVMQHKDTPNNGFGDLFDYFYAYNPWYERFQKSVPDVFWMTYEWDGEINIRIVDQSPLKLEERKALLRLVRSREKPLASVKSTLLVLGKAIIPRRLVLGVRKLFRQRRTSPRRAVNLESLLACPTCEGAVKLTSTEAICQNCGRHYPVRSGIPYMLPDEAATGTLVQSQH